MRKPSGASLLVRPPPRSLCRDCDFQWSTPPASAEDHRGSSLAYLETDGWFLGIMVYLVKRLKLTSSSEGKKTDSTTTISFVAAKYIYETAFGLYRKAHGLRAICCVHEPCLLVWCGRIPS